ncbi:Glutathione S-transferase theta-1 [Labeo rohita]|uniref:Glutathione S-transferase theta-1 n=1 Tax=Labeo rohita TaxID=84645 RepID=A0ABQ8MRX5_LABRO|nr:Glutathione S-transferase theta-1 [Labeo rohita]
MAGRQAVKAYLDLLSQPCRALLIFLKHNKIPHSVELIALRKGQHKTPEFTKLNPMQKVPVLDDNGFVLTESDAILKYLATTYNVPDHWYPKLPEKRARVDEYAAWHHVIFPMMGQLKNDAKFEKALRDLDGTLDMLENMFLKRQAFLCGDDISLADLLAVCEIMQARVGGCSEGRSEISAVKTDSSDLLKWNRYLRDQRRISRYHTHVMHFPSCFWSAQSVEGYCTRLLNPTQPPRRRESFLAHVSMTSEQGGRNSDTFITSMHLAVITSDRFCAEFAHLNEPPMCSGRDILKDRPKLLSWRSRVQSALSDSFDEAHSVVYQIKQKLSAKL